MLSEQVPPLVLPETCWKSREGRRLESIKLYLRGEWERGKAEAITCFNRENIDVTMADALLIYERFESSGEGEIVDSKSSFLLAAAVLFSYLGE